MLWHSAHQNITAIPDCGIEPLSISSFISQGAKLWHRPGKRVISGVKKSIIQRKNEQNSGIRESQTSWGANTRWSAITAEVRATVDTLVCSNIHANIISDWPLNGPFLFPKGSVWTELQATQAEQTHRRLCSLLQEGYVWDYVISMQLQWRSGLQIALAIDPYRVVVGLWVHFPNELYFWTVSF